MLYFETDRLILRDYTEADRQNYIQLKSDKDTMYYLQDIQLFAGEEADADFDNVLTDMRDNPRKFYFLHIEEKGSHAQVGTVGYTVESETPVGKLVHAGYFSYRQYWGNGYMTEAMKKVLEFAFTQNNVYRLSTGCLAENIGSERVMQKCGMIKEAEHIEWEWHDGRMKTRVEYRMLRSDWKKRIGK